MLKGIDVSKYQGILNFTDVKNNFDFIIIKATEGNGYVDPKFKVNQTGLRNAGICLGYYHFARPDLGNTPIAEADWFLKTIGTLQDGEMLCLDYEATWGGDVVGWCYDFLNRVFSITGCRPLIYLNQALVKSKIWNKVFNENFGLWLAVYDYDPIKPCPATPWPSVAIKQYSNKLPYGSLAVDGDVFYGDVNAFKSYGVKINNSDDNMTQDQTNILKFLTEQGANEGKVREAFGDMADLPNLTKKITDLETSQKDLEARIAQLEADAKANNDLISGYQSQLTTAKSTESKLQAQIDAATAQSNVWKNRYEVALKKTIDKYTKWQLFQLIFQK